MSAYSGTMEESQLLSSVYFDSRSLVELVGAALKLVMRCGAEMCRKREGGPRALGDPLLRCWKGPDATSYQERIRREEGARLVRPAESCRHSYTWPVAFL